MKIRAYPYPYRAWLSLANDPDNTNLQDWRELDELIWQELQLPFGDSVFVHSYNANLPDQVNLQDHPEIAGAHPIDIIHTWGDYMHGRRRGFDREDALEALRLLELHSLSPRVWIDHSRFPGNLLHNSQLGGVASTSDCSGHSYTNFYYTLDLIREAGIRYAWDGTITDVLGQDRALTPLSYFRDRSSRLWIAWVKSLGHSIHPRIGALWPLPENSAYRAHRFADGNQLLVFPRFGTWAAADIDGLGEVIQGENLEQLETSGGVCIVYTHLGKRRVGRLGDRQHVCDTTKSSLRTLAQAYSSGSIKVSSTSQLLDYLVLRDHAELDPEAGVLNLRCDGVRFCEPGEVELNELELTIQSGSGPPEVQLEGRVLLGQWRQDSEGTYTALLGRFKFEDQVRS